MNKFTALLAASALVASSVASFAGGPVKVEDDKPVIVVAEGSSSSGPNLSLGSLGGGAGAAVAVIAAVALVAAAANNSGSH